MELTRKPASSSGNGGELDNTASQTIAGAKIFTGATTFSSALTPTGGIVGKTDGVAIASGQIGEVYRTSYTGGALTTTVAGRSAIINLPSSGVWAIYVLSGFTGTATSCTSQRASVSTSDAINFTPSATATFLGNNASYNVSTSIDQAQVMAPLILNTSSAQTIYIWSAATFTGGAMNHYGYVTAYRIA